MYPRSILEKTYVADKEKYRKRVDLDMKTEFELGFGIEEFIQISIIANFAMENYYGRTNPDFYKAVMSYYEVLEGNLASFQTGQDKRFAALEEAAIKHRYNELLQKSKKEAIEKYLEKCQQIIEPLGQEFECDKWYAAQHCNDTVQERKAIINLMGEIRKLEEKYMEETNAMNTNQSAQEKKKLVFDRLRYGNAPRESNLGGYIPYKKDMKNHSYFLEPERLASIFGISDGGDA